MPSLSKREVGQRIATIRRARRMTQAELARAAFVSLATVKAVERGARSPSDDTLDSIAAALSVDPSHIVSGRQVEEQEEPETVRRPADGPLACPQRRVSGLTGRGQRAARDPARVPSRARAERHPLKL
jgi:transcriptional regulator with XRE-family HTH domain